jgi:hypothetical protein
MKKSILSMNEHYVNYLEGTFIIIFFCFFSLLNFLYFSYKLWYNYLKLRRKQVRSKCIIDHAYEEVNNAFERSLVFMHKVFDKIFVFIFLNKFLSNYIDASNMA